MIVTVHCVSRQDKRDFDDGELINLKAVCGSVVAKKKKSRNATLYSTHTATVFAKDFQSERGFRQPWIRCGKCLTHEDFPLLLLGEIEVK